MILEGIVTTISPSGEVNIAPMGPRVDADMQRFLLRPFNTSQTFRNLLSNGEGVLHVTDDVMLLAKAALGKLDPLPPLVSATKVRGWVLQDACRAYEFRVTKIDDREERINIEVEVVHRQTMRDFFGFNRAKHAIVEAAILATRTDFLPLDEIEAEYRKFAMIVQKTGEEQERRALEFLQEHLTRVKAAFLPSPSGRGAGGEENAPICNQRPPAPHKLPLPEDLLQFARKLRAEQTDAEALIWSLLRGRRFGGWKFRRQHELEPHVLDFYCHEAALAIELDGGQYSTPVGRKQDDKRTEFIRRKGIRVIRFWNHEVLADTDTILEVIWNALPHKE